jgi:flavin reductase (DIM6/NTAB) family NADH-FMN oxidoreductase RutF
LKKLANFSKIDVFSIKENIFDMLQDEWMLVTAGNRESYNTMTASWGGFGILWRKPIAIIFVRPQRYTFEFTEDNEFFTLSFFGHGNYRKALSFCGSKSGRDFDKAQETGLTPVLTSMGGVAFQEARLVFECKKIYADNIKPEFMLDSSIDSSIYPEQDYHRFYFGEIIGCYEHKRI